MRRFLAGAAVTALALTLTACVTPTDAPAGAYQVGTSYKVTLGRQWSDVSRLVATHERDVRVLSLDGPALNRLYLTDGLSPGEGLVASGDKDKPTPVFRTDFSPNDQMEFVADSVTAMGYLRVETANPRPGHLAGADGVRFDLSARTQQGLDISGAALTSMKGGKLYVILFLAPTEHYYGDGLPEVEQIMSSANLTG